ncbi:MAG: pantetheine-phosphate adenylyltransferase [Deltaproteobacteria bacterium]|nr:MAG: pantetheine-phosphate adenylyltransferase [Deltaproteobacteria bacterium]
MTSRRTAIYAGSFDPITVGHLDVIQRGAKLYDRLIVAVGLNPAKRYWFDLNDRLALVKAVTTDLPHVEVVPFHGLLVEAAREHGAEVILRGLRALSDFDSEFRYGLANRDLSDLETLFMLTDPEHLFVSSSIVKEIATNGGDVSRYVPGPVVDAIRARLQGRED